MEKTQQEVELAIYEKCAQLCEKSAEFSWSVDARSAYHCAQLIREMAWNSNYQVRKALDELDEARKQLNERIFDLKKYNLKIQTSSGLMTINV